MSVLRSWSLNFTRKLGGNECLWTGVLPQKFLISHKSTNFTKIELHGGPTYIANLWRGNEICTVYRCNEAQIMLRWWRNWFHHMDNKWPVHYCNHQHPSLYDKPKISYSNPTTVVLQCDHSIASFVLRGNVANSIFLYLICKSKGVNTKLRNPVLQVTLRLAPLQ